MNISSFPWVREALQASIALHVHKDVDGRGNRQEIAVIYIGHNVMLPQA